jgi:phosphoglycolate phosphatase
VPQALILFDLDGTLADSAPDLAGAANAMLSARGLPELPLAVLRPHGGSGARGMVGTAFGVTPAQPEYEALKNEWFAHYEPRLLQLTRLFDEIEPLLQALQARGLRHGIVTNKAERYAHPVCEGLGLTRQASVIIGGDTTPHRKPHPAPLLEAARRAGVEPAHCVYVGDDERDMMAGRAAGMRTIAAAWGYLGTGKSIAEWPADAIIGSPLELLMALG